MQLPTSIRCGQFFFWLKATILWENTDICLYTQQWDGVDRNIRVITDRVYYINKGFFTGWLYSSCYRIPYGIFIPDPKRAGEKLGEIVQGYCKPNLLVRMFALKLFRPFCYRFFDSWERTRLPPLPDKYKAFPSFMKDYLSKEHLGIEHIVTDERRYC